VEFEKLGRYGNDEFPQCAAAWQITADAARAIVHVVAAACP
jgi:hypothetical protein